MNRFALPLILSLALTPACGGDTESEPAETAVELRAVSDESVRVGETLRLALAVNNPAGETLEYAYEGPPLPGLERVTQIGGTPAGGEFVWTPLASQVGSHDFVFSVTASSGTTQQTARITVEPGSSSAPVFLAPGAGGTFDLSREPCVRFAIEVRDDDSPDVIFTATTTLPTGASLESSGAKTAAFSWCPTPDQIDTSLRWEIGFSADDSEHAPTEHLFVAVLRAPEKEGCPGAAPVVEILSPAKGDEVASNGGYPVIVSVTDDMGVRDAPALYFTTDAPADEDNPDVSRFQQRFCEAEGSQWRCVIPPLSLADGEERVLYVVVSATDNDDPGGTSCDHRTDSELLRFIAVAGGGDEPGVAACGVCTNSDQCVSGVCVSTATGGFCLEPCAGEGAACSAGSCLASVTTEGDISPVCGPRAAACSAGPAPSECTDDEMEDNDSPATATPLGSAPVSGQICSGDIDFFRVSVDAGTQLSATVDQFVHASGDIDLVLLANDETVIATSASTSNLESITWCAPELDQVVLAVGGYAGSENAYRLTVTAEPAACCVDDEFEPNNSFDDPQIVDPGDPISGTICPDDDDYLAFEVTQPSLVTFLLVFESEAIDLDVELYDEAARVVEYSETAGDETIEYLAEVPGIYTLRIYGYRGDAGDYLGELSVNPL